MMCAWQAFLSILPPRLRAMMDKPLADQLQELRLRVDKPPQLVLSVGQIATDCLIREEDLNYIVNTASRYSPWICTSSASGFITAPGGHRIGLCGEAAIKDGVMTGFRTLRSVNIRIARDFPGLSRGLSDRKGSILILGRPGSGKTTLLRDLIRQRSKREIVAVVDERGELFPSFGGFDTGLYTDILTGCAKDHGIETVLRTMGPDTIAVDEITAEADCNALIQAGWCGVSLLATAHASGKEDLLSRPVYKPLVSCGLFDHLVILSSDKSWRVERMEI